MAISINLDRIRKCMNVSLPSGFTSSDKTKKALDNYNQVMSQIIPSEYSLLIDCTEMGVFEQSALTYLEQLFKMYMKTGFKHVVFVNAKNVIQNMQLQKVARSVSGFDGVFVATLNDAYKECEN